MTAALFILFVLTTATVIVAVSGRYLGIHDVPRLAVGLAVWFVYVGTLAYAGILADTALRPPPILFVILPAVALGLWFALRSKAAVAIPLWLPLGLQTFRIGVELFIHHFWSIGLAPKMLTYEGSNWELYTAATAPLAAFLALRGKTTIPFLWNILGLLTLANVVARALLSAPGPLQFFHLDPPTRFITLFPYTFIPAFFVPLALLLHLLALRSIIRRP